VDRVVVVRTKVSRVPYKMVPFVVLERRGGLWWSHPTD